jgi:hypothetical protein
MLSRESRTPSKSHFQERGVSAWRELLLRKAKSSGRPSTGPVWALIYNIASRDYQTPALESVLSAAEYYNMCYGARY